MERQRERGRDKQDDFIKTTRSQHHYYYYHQKHGRNNRRNGYKLVLPAAARIQMPHGSPRGHKTRQQQRFRPFAMAQGAARGRTLPRLREAPRTPAYPQQKLVGPEVAEVAVAARKAKYEHETFKFISAPCGGGDLL